MNRTYKIMFIAILFVGLNIIQLNHIVYSYTEEEVKDIINYTEVQETLSEDEYDVEIKKDDLIESIKLPVIQASIESVLYDSNNFTDINFLTTDSTNENSSWKFVQETVANFFRVTLYIAAIAMITTLIYIAIVFITESYKPPKMPQGTRMFRNPNNGKPEEELRKQAVFEQWLTAMFLIALITVIINLVVNFTDVLTNIVAGYNLEESTFVVYVVEDESSGAGYTFETTLEGLIMFESEYNWSDYAAKNVMFIIGGIIVTCFKYCVYCLFVVRMFIIAVLVAAAPLVVVINAYLQVGRKKGIFRTWLVTFIFCALIKTVISLVYYVMMANNIILKVPLYILVVVAVEVVAVILLIVIFIRSLRRVEKIEQQEYDEIHGNAPATTPRANMMYHNLTYQEIANNLRAIEEENKHGDVNVMVNAMANYLDSAQKEKGEGNKQIFVNNLYTQGPLLRDREPDNSVIRVLQMEKSNWQEPFKNCSFQSF